MKYQKSFPACAAALMLASGGLAPALAEADPFYGQVRLVAQSWCPDGWLPLDGQVMTISSNPTLFSLIGDTYGGNGSSTFALPDMRDRAPVHFGSNPHNGLTYPLGLTGGLATRPLTEAEMPAHTHEIRASDGDPEVNSPSGAGIPNLTVSGNAFYSWTAPGGATLRAGTMSTTGGGGAIDLHQPSTAMTFCIAVSNAYYPIRP